MTRVTCQKINLDFFYFLGVIRRFSINIWIEVHIFCIDWEIKCKGVGEGGHVPPHFQKWGGAQVPDFALTYVKIFWGRTPTSPFNMINAFIKKNAL